MLKVQVPIPHTPLPEDLPSLVIEAFAAEAGPVAVDGVRTVLGTDAMHLALTEAYRDRKIAGKIKDLKRYPGKAEDQPGILTGSLYEGVDSQAEEGVGFSVGIAAGAGESEDGDDYASAIEERTEFLEHGVQSVEMPMKAILETVLGRVILEAGG